MHEPNSRLILVVTLVLAGCVGEGVLDGGPAGAAPELTDDEPAGVPSDNGSVTANLVNARIFNDARTRSALITHPLTTSDLQPIVADSVCHTAESRQAMEYVVRCALPEGASVTFDCSPEVTYLGRVGLAADWGSQDGTCGESCQKWVSACVIAHSNATGVRMQITLSASVLPHGRAGAAHLSAEGAYFGNIFGDNARQIINGCYADTQERLDRVCGRGVLTRPLCSFFTSPWRTPVRKCSDHCATATRDSGARDGEYYYDCGGIYPETVTVFRD